MPNAPANFLDIQRVQALPGTVAANTLYIVRGSTDTEAILHFIGADGIEARHTLTRAEVTGLIGNAIAGANSIRKALTNAARNTLAATLTENALILVTDAHDNTGGLGDATVAAGAAMYFFDYAYVADLGNVAAFTKVAEYESMDVTVTWAAISGKPSSSVADIDDAVAKKHSHANFSDIDSLTSLACAEANKLNHDAQSELTYNGANVRTFVSVQDW